jgi:hypothetical protein
MGMRARWIAWVLIGLGVIGGVVWQPAPAIAEFDPACITDSRQTPLIIINSAPCGTYGIITTRRALINGAEGDVTVQFMVHRPAGAPRALVVLFAGGNMTTGITGDPTTGQVLTAGRNFLVRSAALFAKHGFLTLTLDRPSNGPLPNPEFDLYRTSAAHAHDIVAVTSSVNRANLDVFLAGTSRGTLSVVAQHMLGIGSMLSSPVTSPAGAALYIGHPGTPNLQPGFVQVPVQVLFHGQDACPVTTPANAVALHTQFLLAGVDSRLDMLLGGFDLTGTDGIDACDALTFHGFLGIENAAVRRIARRMEGILTRIQAGFPKNHRPRARAVTLATSVGSPVSVDLSRLVVDPDHDRLTFSLPYAISTRGAPIGLAGTVATYQPAQAGITDGFVYVVSDGRRGVSAAVVTVQVTP